MTTVKHTPECDLTVYGADVCIDCTCGAFEKAWPDDPYPVKCSGCGKMGTSGTFEIEEGDRWECPPCYEAEEARARQDFFDNPFSESK